MKQSDITTGMIAYTRISGEMSRVRVKEQIQRERNGRKQTLYRVVRVRGDGDVEVTVPGTCLQPRTAAALHRTMYPIEESLD